MHPEQIKKAAVELLSEVLTAKNPASEVISNYTRNRRYIGSKDRRALTDMVWRALRFHAHLDFRTPDLTMQIGLLDVADQDLPDMPDWVKWECPDWLIPHIPNAENELRAMLMPAPIVLRANGDREWVQRRLNEEGITTAPTKLSPLGLVLEKRTNLDVSPTFKEGRVEVQDEGSQLIALETNLVSDQTVLDMCAGAGGKSLIFSQMMNGSGRIVAYDVSARSLAELQKRADRARAKNIRTTITLPKELFDTVVVDAPCSGTGTWRRNPDAKWKLTPDQFIRIQETQAQILDQAAPLVRNELCYMTCSLTTDENENQVQAFLARHPEFTLDRQKRFSPYSTDTDGFYIAVMRKT